MRKTKVLAFLILLLGAQVALAQSENQLNIGAKWGANFNQISQSGSHMGGNVGGFVLFNLSDKLGLQGELLYNVLGATKNPFTRSTVNGDVQYVDRSWTVHNAEIPVLVKFNLGAGDDMLKPKLVGGFSYAYTAAVIERRDQVFTNTDINSAVRRSGDFENIGAEFEAHQFAAFFGVSLDYTMNSGKIFMTEVRYRRGLNDINNFGVFEQYGDAWPNTISINFGLSIF
jgi:hypothetical protein